MLQFFDPEADVAIKRRRLPHWSQPGVVCFITFRTDDSMPRSVINRWETDRRSWLVRHGITPTADNWRQQLSELPLPLQQEFDRTFSNRWHDELDACHGACPLRDPSNAMIVADSLRHFDGDRYDLTDFVVMPNHVHLLAAFPDESSMLTQCDSWKHYTATQINRSLGRRGRLWQQDAFDHLLRSEEQFLYLRRYIADNPRKAKLRPGEFLHWTNSAK
ncbi:MAG: transposase [Planctomycetaceae bacterium]|nr:transposase [Planctomycetaceae bacterium]